MSYVDEVYERVVAQNPAQPEFHQAVKEVLESLRVVIEKNEEKYRKEMIKNMKSKLVIFTNSYFIYNDNAFSKRCQYIFS